MLLGSHVSIAGSLARPFADAREIGCDAIQVFVKPPRRLRGIKDFTPAQVAVWEEARAASGVQAVVTHANYLINLAAVGHTGEYSREAFLDELKRCHELRIPHLIFHPGQHQGQGVDKGIVNIAKALQWAIQQGEDYADVTILLENMAGQGTMVGWDFAHLADIIDLVGAPERLGICVDTCHTLAAGYELRTPEGYAKTLEAIEGTVGLDKVKVFHLNDSKMDLGTRVDRHEAIGKGMLGDGAFKLLLQDPRWASTPGLLETPHDDNKGFAKDLKRLRKCAAEPYTDKDLPKQRALRV
jgi:deoxyribonuclease IV